MDNPLLTIGIPTYNRGDRLEKTILKLFDSINSSGLNKKVSILVSNNNSEDHTSEVLFKLQHSADAYGIKFSYKNQPVNIGPAKNFIECAFLASTEYLVFLSDDDNLYPNSLLFILDCIEKYEPNVLVFNFNQKPWDLENPLYPLVQKFTRNSDFVQLNKLIKWYKLSGVTLNVEDKTQIEFLRNENFYSKYFGHVLLAVLIAKARGNLLLHPFFFAFPDDDYLDHVNFAPYVSEMMYSDLQVLFEKNLVTGDEFEKLSSLLPRQSVFSRSIHRLYEYYSGKFLLTKSVRNQLWINILDCLLFRRRSRESLPLQFQFMDLLRLVRLLLIWIKFRIRLALKLADYKIEKEGF
jgi:glycosyltransferase involved in cell wall biosynthesis